MDPPLGSITAAAPGTSTSTATTTLPWPKCILDAFSAFPELSADQAWYPVFAALFVTVFDPNQYLITIDYFPAHPEVNDDLDDDSDSGSGSESDSDSDSDSDLETVLVLVETLAGNVVLGFEIRAPSCWSQLPYKDKELRLRFNEIQWSGPSLQLVSTFGRRYFILTCDRVSGKVTRDPRVMKVRAFDMERSTRKAYATDLISLKGQHDLDMCFMAALNRSSLSTPNPDTLLDQQDKINLGTTAPWPASFFKAYHLNKDLPGGLGKIWHGMYFTLLLAMFPFEEGYRVTATGPEENSSKDVFRRFYVYKADTVILGFQVQDQSYITTTKKRHHVQKSLRTWVGSGILQHCSSMEGFFAISAIGMRCATYKYDSSRRLVSPSRTDLEAPHEVIRVRDGDKSSADHWPMDLLTQQGCDRLCEIFEEAKTLPERPKPVYKSYKLQLGEGTPYEEEQQCKIA
ncbi:hypothetical protein BGZ83_008636 [Gryganskiella cystojenkinii]|nr:hypothetical protein BGZ83_008636 [Gryganskiella cystojenkinii]